jgi:hypothetical protein
MYVCRSICRSLLVLVRTSAHDWGDAHCLSCVCLHLPTVRESTPEHLKTRTHAFDYGPADTEYLSPRASTSLAQISVLLMSLCRCRKIR